MTRKQLIAIVKATENRVLTHFASNGDMLVKYDSEIKLAIRSKDVLINMGGTITVIPFTCITDALINSNSVAFFTENSGVFHIDTTFND